MAEILPWFSAFFEGWSTMSPLDRICLVLGVAGVFSPPTIMSLLVSENVALRDKSRVAIAQDRAHRAKAAILRPQTKRLEAQAALERDSPAHAVARGGDLEAAYDNSAKAMGLLARRVIKADLESEDPAKLTRLFAFAQSLGAQDGDEALRLRIAARAAPGAETPAPSVAGMSQEAVLARIDALNRRAGDNLGRTGDYAATLRLADEGLALARAAELSETPVALTAAQARCAAMIFLSNPELALKEAEALLPIQERILGQENPNSLTTRYLRALALCKLDQADGALEEIDTMLTVRTRVSGPKHPDTLATRYLRAQALQDLNRVQEALQEMDRLLPLRTDVSGPAHLDTLKTGTLRVAILQRLNRRPEALAEATDTARIALAAHGPDHPVTKEAQEWVSGLTAEIAAEEAAKQSAPPPPPAP